MKREMIVGIMLTLLTSSMLTLAFRVQPVNSEPVAITVVGGWTGAEMDAFLPVLQAFENQTGINVNYTAYTYYELLELLEAQFAAGTTPGDVICLGSRFIKEKGQEGHIIDATSLINEANFSADVLDLVKVCDTLYGGPYTGKVKPGFWYRKSFFTAHNLTEPTNWAEFLALLDDIAGISGIENPIASGDGVGWPLSDVTEHFLITFGGPQLHRNLTVGTVAWNSSQVRTIFAERLVPLLQGNFSDPIEWTTALDLWWNGTYGLYFMGSWITGMVDDPDDLGVFSLPGSEGLVFGPDFFFLPVYTEHLDEAKQLFQFLAGAEAQTFQVEQGGHIATNLGVPLEAYPAVDRMVVNLTTGKELLYDLDDAIGGEFQTTFWDQMKLLWVEPGSLDDVLNALEAVAPTTIRVPKDFPTIQEAINAASSGDTIYVCSGTYYENVVVNKTLTLVGESRSTTIIDGSGLTYEGALVAIVIDNVDMGGFTVTNAAHQGVEVTESHYCEVHDNIVCFTGDRGLVFGGGGNNKAYNNVVYNTSAYGGIEAIWSSNNTICNNVVYFNEWWGIATNAGSYNRIFNNEVYSNGGTGIHVDWPSTDNVIYNNDIISNGELGICVMNHANRTVISYNRISGSYHGIHLEDSFANNISGNYIIDNVCGVTLDLSENNTFYHNNFIGNTQQVYIVPSMFNIWDDGYPHGGNYWSDYTGGDLYSGPGQDISGSDGIGDVPYVIDANNTDRYPLMRTLYYKDRMTQVVSTESTKESFEPSLAVDSSGNVHVAWWEYAFVGAETESDILYKKFVAGSGWTSTEVVSTESTAFSAPPSLAVDSKGNVHVAWCDATDYAGSGSDLDIFYKRYEVGPGWTSTEVVSTESTADSYHHSLAVDSRGDVHVVWCDDTDLDCGTDRDIFYKNRTSSWGITEVVSTESTGPSYCPSLAVDSSGNVHVAWHDHTDLDCGTDKDIFYKNRTSSWGTTIVVSTESTADSYCPSLAIDSRGNVHVAWHDHTNYAGCGTDWDIFYKRYEVGVRSTTTEVISTESTGNSRYPSLGVDLAGNLHVAWEDYTDFGGCGSGADIFYKYICLHSTQYSWPMFHHNPRHTGYTESPAPDTNKTQWTYPTGGWVESSPAVAEGIVYVGSNDGKVYALDQHTGAQIWNYTAGWSVSSSPAVAYGKVYIGEEDGKVYCLDATTGAHIWNQTIGDYVHSSPTVVDGKVYIGAGYGEGFGRVCCLDAATGAHIWNYTAGDYVRSSPAVAYGKVYVGLGDIEIYEYVICCLDALTGAHIWNYTVGDYVDSSPTVAYGKVYVGSWDGKVYCLNALTGAHVWNHTVAGYVDSSPGVADDKIYIGTGYGIIYCLDAATGAHMWNQTTGDWVASSPAAADGKVYVGSWDGKVYCLDASTGAYVWNYTTGSGVESSPAVADGMVFIGSRDHTLYAFGNTIRVPEDHPTIQQAIDAAQGTVISIAPGIYYEHLVINKSITLMGRPGSTPIFEGDASGIAITIIDTCEVVITNIAITNYDLGIFITDSNDCKIYSNIMSLMGSSGIALEGTNAADNLIYKNIFRDNTIAINLTESSTSNIIYANTISENDIGIDMPNSNNNVIYHNNFVDNTVQVYISMPIGNIWDNGYPSGGNYWSDYGDRYPGAQEIDGSGIWDTPYEIDANNVDRYPLVNPFIDIGITKITISKTIVGQGYSVSITIKILNYGVSDEDSPVTVYADTTLIHAQTVTLTSRGSTTVTFLWDTTGVPKGNYTLSATADVVLGEIDTLDNSFTDGWILVTVPGDVNGDCICDMADISMMITAFMTKPGDEKWDANCDVNCDDVVDMADISIAITNFMKTCANP